MTLNYSLICQAVPRKSFACDRRVRVQDASPPIESAFLCFGDGVECWRAFYCRYVQSVRLPARAPCRNFAGVLSTGTIKVDSQARNIAARVVHKEILGRRTESKFRFRVNPAKSLGFESTWRNAGYNIVD